MSMVMEEAIDRCKHIVMDKHFWSRENQIALNMVIKASEEQANVLDKMKSEIEQLRLHKAEFITSDNKVCIDSQEVLNIIDKYIGNNKE